MNIRLIILPVVLACLIGLGICAPVGSTSQWGIVVSPCAGCGTTNNIEVHHIYPQHLWPDRARDTNNMVCFCRTCHFTVGHKNNWTNSFTNVMDVIKVGQVAISSNTPVLH